MIMERAFVLISTNDLMDDDILLDQLKKIDGISDDPARWEQESGGGRLEPSRHLSLRSVIEKALEFERAAIGLYNDLANATKDKDHGTYQLALGLLKDELEDEQTMEDILARLEIQDTK
jgi:bacterioferritin